jgi:hypothetical protein
MISRGFKPDLVIVDYGDLLKPPKGSYSGEKRHDLEAVFEDLRAIAISYGVHVATASQVHRASANEEVITMEAIAEAYAKCFIADFIISLSRTRKDEPTKGGRIFVAKNRNGADNLVFPAYVDVSSVTIRVLPIIETKTVEQINEDAQRNTAKEQLQKVREVYQKEIKNKKKGEKVNE